MSSWEPSDRMFLIKARKAYSPNTPDFHLAPRQFHIEKVGKATILLFGSKSEHSRLTWRGVLFPKSGGPSSFKSKQTGTPILVSPSQFSRICFFNVILTTRKKKKPWKKLEMLLRCYSSDTWLGFALLFMHLNLSKVFFRNLMEVILPKTLPSQFA